MIATRTMGAKASAAAAATAAGRCNPKKKLGTLRVFGMDGHGIVAACTDVLGRHGANIVRSEHWTDTSRHLFFQRLAFQYDPRHVDRDACRGELSERLAVASHPRQQQEQQSQTSQPLEAHWNWRDRCQRVGIMVSKQDHCLWELLLRHSAHELDMDVAVVISNHDDLRHVADTFGIPFHSCSGSSHNDHHHHHSSSSSPSPSPSATTTTMESSDPYSDENSNKNYTAGNPNDEWIRTDREARQLRWLKDANVDVVVLARYMQVLSPNFLSHFPPWGVINIHHSFLPAFLGGHPYHRAHERGVKLVGATAHYVTEHLDDGPIIGQDVIAVSHRDGLHRMMKKGRILERNVLLGALEAHLDDRIIVHENRCIVFGD
jgi:formyltetrahydrofolate deformylase